MLASDLLSRFPRFLDAELQRLGLKLEDPEVSGLVETAYGGLLKLRAEARKRDMDFKAASKG